MANLKPITNNTNKADKVQTEVKADKSEMRLSDLRKINNNKSKTPRKNQSMYGEKAPKGSSKKV